jgi:hypothetical protein
MSAASRMALLRGDREVLGPSMAPPRLKGGRPDRRGYLLPGRSVKSWRGG